MAGKSRELSAVEIVAVSKALKTAAVKKASGGISVGEHEVDVMVRFFGSISKSKDEDKTVWSKVKWDRLAAILWGKVNADTRNKVLAEYKNDELAAEKSKDEAEEAVKQAVGQTKTNFNGKITTGSLNAEVVEVAGV